MMYIVAGSLVIILVMLDIVWTTLTTRGEGKISATVSGGFRMVSHLAMHSGYRISEFVGAVSLMALGAVWLAGLWIGWVLVFLGLPDAVTHSQRSTTDIYDLVYFVGFTLSTLGVGDVTPMGPAAQMATAFASFTGLLVVTLVVTYAISVVSGVVARRVLAYEIYLVGEEGGEFLVKFASADEFSEWIATIKKDLIFCTEQRLAYPILDNFVAKEKKYSLPVQLGRLGLAAQEVFQTDSVSKQSRRKLNELFSVLFRYTSLTGLTEGDLVGRLRKLEDM